MTQILTAKYVTRSIRVESYMRSGFTGKRFALTTKLNARLNGFYVDGSWTKWTEIVKLTFLYICQMSSYSIGKMTNRLGLSRSSGSFDGSNVYEAVLCAIDPTASWSVFCSTWVTSSMPLSLSCFWGTLGAFSVNGLRGLCGISLKNLMKTIRRKKIQVKLLEGNFEKLSEIRSLLATWAALSVSITNSLRSAILQND